MKELFTAIDHVGVAVPDFDAAVAFYRDVLGMEFLHEETNEEQGVHEAMMGVGSSGSCIQILAPLTPESTIATRNPRPDASPTASQRARGFDGSLTIPIPALC